MVMSCTDNIYSVFMIGTWKMKAQRNELFSSTGIRKNRCGKHLLVVLYSKSLLDVELIHLIGTHWWIRSQYMLMLQTFLTLIYDSCIKHLLWLFSQHGMWVMKSKYQKQINDNRNDEINVGENHSRTQSSEWNLTAQEPCSVLSSLTEVEKRNIIKFALRLGHTEA